MKERLDGQIRFLIEIDKLKHVVRRTRLFDGSRNENDVEHSWHLSLAALVLAEHSNHPIDVAKAVKMVLIHDIVEIDAGDFFFYDADLKKDKEESEKKAAGRIFGLLPTDQQRDFLGLWEEFEQGETAEARFAAALDRLEPLMQNALNAGDTWRKFGITHDEVLRRNGPIVAGGSGPLWKFLKGLIDESAEKGHFSSPDCRTGGIAKSGSPGSCAVGAHATKLSVNLNKIALIRNSRENGIPSVTRAARICIEAGAHGITVHPRPDERHIRESDVFDLAELLSATPAVEFNIEGNPFPRFMELVRKVKPAQCTLVPDSPGALTSDHGWDLAQDGERLRPLIRTLKEMGIRVSLFMDADSPYFAMAREIGADRVELYTEPYAQAYGGSDEAMVFEHFRAAAQAAGDAGLGVNGGHDLNLENLGRFCTIPGILEVSIGHALVSDALEMGLSPAVQAYLHAINGPDISPGG